MLAARMPLSTAIKSRQRGSLGPLRGSGQTDDRQSRRGDRHASPLAASEAKPKEALGEHGEEDEPPGQDRLHARQRRAGERPDVQAPRDQRDDPPHRKPSRAKQVSGAAHRMAWLDRRGEHRAAVLEQEAQVGAHRGPQRKDQSGDHRLGLSVQWAGRSLQGLYDPRPEQRISKIEEYAMSVVDGTDRQSVANEPPRRFRPRSFQQFARLRSGWPTLLLSPHSGARRPCSAILPGPRPRGWRVVRWRTSWWWIGAVGRARSCRSHGPLERE
jgi:hypothetical protein